MTVLLFPNVFAKAESLGRSEKAKRLRVKAPLYPRKTQLNWRFFLF
jgi:hypothetical protein